MTRLAPLHAVPAALALALAVGCGGGNGPDPGAPRPLGTGAPGAEEPAAAPETAEAPTDPRLLLFDIQTALEAARATEGAYPVPAAFEVEEKWRVQRRRLDAAFDGWDYVSDGRTFRLRGTIGERAWSVSGP